MMRHAAVVIAREPRSSGLTAEVIANLGLAVKDRDAARGRPCRERWREIWEIRENIRVEEISCQSCTAQ